MSNRNLFHISLAVAGLSVLVFALILLKGDVDRWMGALVIVVVLILASIILLPVFWWAAHAEQKQSQELKTPGNYWAHWHYDDKDKDERNKFAQAEWARVQRKSWVVPLKILGWSVVGLLGVEIVRHPPHDLPPFSVPIIM